MFAGFFQSMYLSCGLRLSPSIVSSKLSPKVIRSLKRLARRIERVEGVLADKLHCFFYVLVAEQGRSYPYTSKLLSRFSWSRNTVSITKRDRLPPRAASAS